MYSHPRQIILSYVSGVYREGAAVNKKEAAQYLGVSTRAVERYVQQGKLHIQYVQGKHGREALYDDDEVKAFFLELQAPVHRTVPESTTNSEQAWATAAIQQHLVGEMVVEALVAAIEIVIERQEYKRRPTAPVEEKLLLTLKEAQALTGLSQQHLREAIRSGKLHAPKVGRARRIARRDLEHYIVTHFSQLPDDNP